MNGSDGFGSSAPYGFQMTLGIFFSTRVAILQTVVNYDSFEGKVLILL